MRIIPTRRFWILVALGLPIALLGAWVGGVERLVLPYNVALLLLLFGSRAMLGNLRLLTVSRSMDVVLSARALNIIRLEIANNGKINLKGRFRDECPPSFESEPREFRFALGGGESADFSYRVRPHERGTDVFPESWIRLQVPLGLCEVEYRVENRQDVRVYPNLKALENFDLLNRRGRLSLIGIRRTRFRGLGTEFESLRDYELDDDFRRVDWKTSARRGKLVVREYELEKNQAVFVVVDVGRGMLSEAAGATKLDHVLDTALMLMHAAEFAGDQVGLLVYGEKVLTYIAPRRGRMQINMILDALHDLSARPVESDHQGAMTYLASRWKRRALVVVFTDLEDKREASRFISAVRPQRTRHLWFVARVRDPKLAELREQPLEKPKQLYDRAALSWYEAERARADELLRAEYAGSLDEEPQDLARALVGAYIDAKQRALL